MSDKVLKKFVAGYARNRNVRNRRSIFPQPNGEWRQIPSASNSPKVGFGERQTPKARELFSSFEVASGREALPNP